VWSCCVVYSNSLELCAGELETDFAKRVMFAQDARPLCSQHRREQFALLCRDALGHTRMRESNREIHTRRGDQRQTVDQE